ncbi:MAG: succinate--CoA ligase subunit alpha, partial [Desulfobacterales bacterium]|nr:succinate--CoA ligase subunit alpha [Desulfobacterales bacterium]
RQRWQGNRNFEMAILIASDTRVLIQGATGKVGSFQTRIMRDYGTRIAAAVTPGKGGTRIHEVPVFDSVAEAVSEHEVDAAISFVPARFAKDAALEVINSGIGFLVLTAEGIPELDILTILRSAALQGTNVLGPDTPGLISPGKCKLGVHPQTMFLEGHVGIVSKSGSLSYEVGRVLTQNGMGQSTVVGIGGGPIWGLSQEAVLQKFEEDPETTVVVLLGEVGGRLEHDAAKYIRHHMKKPVIALIVGRTAPAGAQMGHAGAIIEGQEATASSKIKALENAGAVIARNSTEIPELIKEME